MKKAIVISAIFLSGLYLFGKPKVDKLITEYQNALNQLKIKFGSVSNISINNSLLTANVVLKIGYAFPNLENISVPAHSEILTTPIPVQILMNTNALLVGLDLAQNTKDIKVVAEVTAFSQTYTIAT